MSATIAEPPSLTHALTVRVDVGTPLEVGEVAGTRRRVVPILGGSVGGPRLQGSVLPGGADWQSVRAGGVVDLTARYTLRAADGTLISAVNAGLRRAAPAVPVLLAAVIVNRDRAVNPFAAG